MEPVVRGLRCPLKDEFARIVTAGGHGGADDSSHIKRLQHVTIIAINFQDCGFEVGRGIRLNEYSPFTGDRYYDACWSRPCCCSLQAR